MNLISVLKDFGLTRRQADLYLHTMELGSASAYRIAKKANVPRSTCYEELGDLKDLGLVSTFRKKKVRYYAAEDPKKFIRSQKEKIEVFEEMLPDFNALYGTTKNRPRVRFYQGLSGMKTIFNELVDDRPISYDGFGSADDLFEKLGDWWPKHIKRRVKKKISVRAILWDSARARQRKRLGKKHLRQVKIISPKYRHHGITITWQNKIAMFSFKKEIMALVVESEILAHHQKTMFEVLWENLG